MPFDPADLITLQTADGSRAVIHRHGAHVVSWRPAGGNERLFVSSRAEAGPGKAVRGGIPVIFPQFADVGPLPKHGFARSVRWRFAGSSATPDGAVARFTLANDIATHTLWPHDYFASLDVALRDSSLTTTLAVANLSAAPFSFTAALHTYLSVADVEHAALVGLDGCAYRDSAAGGGLAREAAPSLAFAGEVDRVYLATPKQLRLLGGATPMTIEMDGFSDTVVWNPGAAKAAQLKDLGDGEWQRFVCVEAASVAVPVEVPAGGVWRGWQRLSIL
jgi:glucose-6-phosphate 1-epimerase